MKKYNQIKRLLSILMTAGAIVLMLILHYHITFSHQSSPKALGGYLDLSDWNFSESGLVFLNGEWGFYPRRLYLPEELPTQPGQAIKVPGGWELNRGYEQPARGSGTYHLTVKLPQTTPELALKVQNIWMAHRLYVNGELVGSMGTTSESKTGYEPRNTPYLIRLKPADQLELVLQVSNYIYYTGGIIHSIQLGEAVAMDMRMRLSFGLDLAGFFLFMMFGVYHLYMYQMRYKESTYLYSGLYLLIFSIITATTGEKLLMQLFPTLPFVIPYKLQDFAVSSSFVVLILFMQSLEPGILKKNRLLLLMLPIFSYILLILLSPLTFYILIKPAVTVYIALLTGALVIRLLFLLIRGKDCQLPFNELSCVVLGLVCVGIMLLNAMLYYSGYVKSDLVERISMLGFLLSLNILMARRFTNKMYEVQVLSEELQKSDEIFLQVQIKPHFLYNAISNIIALCYEDGEKAADMLTLLSRYLRHIFQTDRSRQRVSLKQELDIIEAYVEIEKLRFGHRLQYETYIDPEIIEKEVHIPSLLIQPLIENAIRHGLFNKQGTGRLTLRITQGEDFIRIMVEDDGVGVSEDKLYQLMHQDTGSGVGIPNIRKRVKAIHRANFLIDSELGRGTKCVLLLPKEALKPSR